VVECLALTKIIIEQPYQEQQQTTTQTNP